MISALIIDDEQDAREGLGLLIKNYCPNQLEVLGEAETITKAIALIDQLKPDLVFLDIMIGENNGFDLLEKCLFKDFVLIFTTGHSEFAAKAFRYDAIDYLLKPINPNHLIIAVQKADKAIHFMSKVNNNSSINASKEDGKLAIYAKNGITFITLEDIIRIKGDGNYSHFYLRDGQRVTASKNLGSFDDLIHNKYFLRLHQSYIVNFKYLHKILYEEGTFVVTTDGFKTPVSRANKEVVKEFVKTLFNI